MKSVIIAIILIPSLLYANKDNTKTQGGRFQLIQLSDMRRDQYLLDTQTGKIWKSVCSVGSNNGMDCDMAAWVPDHVVGITISDDAYYKRVRDFKQYLIEEEKKAAAASKSNN